MLSLAAEGVPIDIPFSWRLRCHGIPPLHLQEPQVHKSQLEAMGSTKPLKVTESIEYPTAN